MTDQPTAAQGADWLLPPDARPLPVVSDLNRPFWDGARRGELLLQHCQACGELRYPIVELCPLCLSARTGWQRVSGHGRVFSYVVFHRAYRPSFRPHLPYNAALIQLVEGPMLFSNVAAATDRIRCDMPVEVDFQVLSDEITVPVFRPSTDPGPDR